MYEFNAKARLKRETKIAIETPAFLFILKNSFHQTILALGSPFSTLFIRLENREDKEEIRQSVSILYFHKTFNLKKFKLGTAYFFLYINPVNPKGVAMHQGATTKNFRL
ncbi:hypothetical protein [Thalassobacillus sp. C254]|uniref:hypothetical protein n=1 Tax=Thalassobacillus sp. C254 TaxID=1225341 RepID=UPI0012EEC826|nr:hypothetical protein [Thalassobacillus sp. C254]